MLKHLNGSQEAETNSPEEKFTTLEMFELCGSLHWPDAKDNLSGVLKALSALLEKKTVTGLGQERHLPRHICKLDKHTINWAGLLISLDGIERLVYT